MARLETVTRLLVTAMNDVQRLTMTLDATIATTELAVFELFANGRIARLNAPAEQLIGVAEQDAVGKMFAHFTADADQTHAAIGQLLQHAELKSWPEQLIRAGSLVMNGIGLGPSPAGSQRVVIWCGQESTEPIHQTQPSFLPDTRRILGADIDIIKDRLNISILELCQQLGIATPTLYAWRRKANQPIKKPASRITFTIVSHISGFDPLSSSTE